MMNMKETMTMAIASYTNDKVNAHNGLTLILGRFDEREHGKVFEYAIRPDTGNDFAPDCPHIVFVGGLGETRFARVLKTVAWVAVDETDTGEAIYERWNIKQHKEYDTAKYTKWA